jgi:hypothetical protein
MTLLSPEAGRACAAGRTAVLLLVTLVMRSLLALKGYARFGSAPAVARWLVFQRVLPPLLAVEAEAAHRHQW